MSGDLFYQPVDVGRRLLESAIACYFEERNPITLQTLVGRAHESFASQQQTRSGPAMAADEVIDKAARAGELDTLRQRIEVAIQSCREAGRGEPLRFNLEETEFVLWKTCLLGREITGEFPPLARVFHAWFMIKHDGLFDLPSELASIKSRLRKTQHWSARQQFYSEMIRKAPVFLPQGVEGPGTVPTSLR